jgi:tellurite resistance protein
VRIPPGFFGIPFGIAGLADVWNAARPILGIPQSVPNTLFIVAAVIWAVVLLAYFAQGLPRIIADARDQILAPLLSLAVITPMLISSALADYALTAAKVLVSIFLALTVLYGGWLTGQWITRAVDQDAAYPGFFLPTVAGGLVASFAASRVGMAEIAQGMFGIGIFCWLLLGSLLLNRLFFRPGLPAPLVPTLAIELAPPAVAGIAYFAMNHGVPDAVATALGGYTVLMALVQLRLIPVYAKLRFSAALWSFTFAYAAGFTDGMLWISAKNPPGATAWTAIGLGLITAFIGAIFVGSVLALMRGRFLPQPAAA